MELIVFGYVAVGLLGLVFGSFAGATVWRLRAYQLKEDKASGEEVDAKELKRLQPLTKTRLKDDRSRCLHCQHELTWYDLLPLVSWLSTKGRCRYCKKPIGRFEPLIELGTSITFIALYAWLIGMYGFFGVPLVLLALWLIASVLLVILFAYDLRWYLLPNVIMFPLIGVSALICIFQISVSSIGDDTITGPLLSVAGSILILAGLYLTLWLVSKGKWVGFGDVKLGLALGLLLVDWKLALLTLFLANLIGTLVVIPGLITKKLARGAQVPFGPFLIIGFFISLIAGPAIMSGYDTFSVWLTTTLLML